MHRLLRSALVTLTLVGLLAGSVACGKYGPPVRPEKDPGSTSLSLRR